MLVKVAESEGKDINMSYEVKQGNIFGRIGTGIGQGLAEQLPKEVERYRLTKGLEDFEKQAPNLSPLAQATRLASIPGMTPEMMYTLGPFIKQAAQRMEAKNLPQEVKKPSGEKEKVSKEKPLPSGEKPSQFKGLKPLESTKAQMTPIVRKSPEQINSEAADLFNNAPNIYPTFDAAKQEIVDRENREIQNIQEQRAAGETANALRERVKNNLIKRWGGEKATENIDPGIQTRLLDQYENELADPNNKKSEAELERKYGDLGKKIAKANTNLRVKSRESFTEMWPSKRINTIKEARKAYEEANSLDEYQDIISGEFNLTAPMSAYLTFPPSKEAEKIINTLSKDLESKFEPLLYASTPRINKASIMAADEISRLDLSNQSLLGLSEYARQNGLNEKVFYNRLVENMDKGLIDSNQRHEIDRQRGIPSSPSLGDLWLRMAIND